MRISASALGTATFIGSVKVPAKIICVIEVLVKPSKFVIVAGIASLRNVLSIRLEAGGSDFGLNIAFLSSFTDDYYSSGSFVAYSRGCFKAFVKPESDSLALSLMLDK